MSYDVGELTDRLKKGMSSEVGNATEGLENEL